LSGCFVILELLSAENKEIIQYLTSFCHLSMMFVETAG
jgi:hypothetical protein